jgi:hypothetical protein
MSTASCSFAAAFSDPRACVAKFLIFRCCFVCAAVLHAFSHFFFPRTHTHTRVYTLFVQADAFDGVTQQTRLFFKFFFKKESGAQQNKTQEKKESGAE